MATGGIPPGGGAPPAGGSGVPPDFTVVNAVNDLNSAVDSAATTKALQAIADGLTKMGSSVETTSKKIGRFRDDVKGIIMFTDDAAEAVKGFSDKTKELAKNLLQDKSYKHTKSSLTEMVKLLKEMASRTKDNKVQYAGITAQIIKMESAQKKLGETTEGVFDKAEGAVDEYAKALNDAGKAMGRLAASSAKMGKMRLGGEAVGSIRQNLIDAGMMKPGRFEKFAAMGIGAKKLKEAAQIKQDETTAVRSARRASAQSTLEDLEKKGHIKLQRNADGGVNWGAMAADRKRVAKAGGAAGAGDLGTTMAALQQAGATPKGGLMGKLTGGGLVEGTVGAVAGLAGQMALPLAIAEAVKDMIASLFDKNANMNKQAETLAGGGLIGGTRGQTGAQDLMAARSNLMPTYGVSALGLSYDRNIKMAQSVIESGYDVSELGQGGVHGAKRGDFGPGSFGDIQELAATTGRVSGLGDDKSIELTMKLLMQYRKSVEGTKDFMTNLNKDFRTAGLSVTKYVSILDEITGQFDRMNKSIDQTSGILRALGTTGRMTSEDLEASMKTILGDPKRDVGMQIFLNSQMRRPGVNGGTSVATEAAAKQAVYAGTEADNAIQALTALGAGKGLTDKQIKEKIQTPQGRDELNAMLTGFSSDNPMVDSKKLKAAQGALETAGKEAQRGQKMAAWAAGTLSDNEMQAVNIGLGKNPQVQANENLAAAKTVMQLAGISTKALYEEGGAANTQEFEQASKPFGLAPTFLSDQQKILKEEGDARLKAALTNETTAKDTYDMFRGKGGIVGPDAERRKNADGTMESYKEALERWTKEKTAGGFGGKFQQLLRGQDEGLIASYDSAASITAAMSKTDKDKAKADIDEQARSVGMVTQTSAEIFATAFSYYFNAIIDILTDISSFFGGTSKADKEQAKKMSQDAQTPLAEALVQNGRLIDDIKNRLLTATGNDKDTLKTQLDDEQGKRLRLEQAKAGDNQSPQQMSNAFDIAKDEFKYTQAQMLKGLDAAGDKIVDNLVTLTPEQMASQKDLFANIDPASMTTTTDKNDKNKVINYIYNTQYDTTHNMKTGVMDDAQKTVAAPPPMVDTVSTGS